VSEKETIDLSALTKGVYFIVLKSDGFNKTTKKIIVR
jgi:hypothetical protein